ncbi:Uncharacterised protein [Mycobacteroides abscessus subsp. abscessus]|nr:Uncharacterised protein [Mycobacteroides abscessus subsp. abscessus]
MKKQKMTPDEIDRLFFMKHKKGIKNKEVAEAVGCSQTHISRLFKHDATISAERQHAVADFIRNY